MLWSILRKHLGIMVRNQFGFLVWKPTGTYILEAFCEPHIGSILGNPTRQQFRNYTLEVFGQLQCASTWTLYFESMPGTQFCKQHQKELLEQIIEIYVGIKTIDKLQKHLNFDVGNMLGHLLWKQLDNHNWGTFRKLFCGQHLWASQRTNAISPCGAL